MPARTASRRLVLASVSSLLALATWFAGCDKSTGPGDPNGIQDSIHAFISSPLIDTLRNLGMPIYEGNTPPNIEGMYFGDAQRLKSSNVKGDGIRNFNNLSLRLSGQTGAQRVNLEYDWTTERGSGTGAFITGSGNTFTVYVPVHGSYTRNDTTIYYQDAFLYSGRVDSTGIHGYANGLLVTSKDNDPHGIVLGVGQGRVIVESDSLASRVTDYPHTAAPAKRSAEDAGTAGSGR